jgi:hypothetical protein
VTTDIYGKEETVGSYEVYRGELPGFVPSPGNLLATEPAGQTSSTDENALLPAVPDYYYLVRAVDLEGNVGGLGRQLPDGIGALVVDRAGECSVTVTQPCRNDSECPQTETCIFASDDLILSWPPVDVDFDEGPTAVDRYEIYTSVQPFTRADIRDGTVPMLTSVPGTSLQVTPPSENQHYSVIAVDVRGNESPF